MMKLENITENGTTEITQSSSLQPDNYSHNRISDGGRRGIIMKN